MAFIQRFFDCYHRAWLGVFLGLWQSRNFVVCRYFQHDIKRFKLLVFG